MQYATLVNLNHKGVKRRQDKFVYRNSKKRPGQVLIYADLSQNT